MEGTGSVGGVILMAGLMVGVGFKCRECWWGDGGACSLDDDTIENMIVIRVLPDLMRMAAVENGAIYEES